MNCSSLLFSPLCDSCESLVLCGTSGSGGEDDDGDNELDPPLFVFPPGNLLTCGAPLEPGELVGGCLSIRSGAADGGGGGGRDHDNQRSEDGDAISLVMATPATASAASPSPFVDPYRVLQVRRDATPAEIRRAYQRLALWHHPGRSSMDWMPPQERARRRQVFEVLAACYETLIDKPVRARLDALLREAEPAASSGSSSNGARRRPKSPPTSAFPKRTRQSAAPTFLRPRSANAMPSLSTVSAGSSSDDESVDSDGGNARGETNGDEEVRSCRSQGKVKKGNRRTRLDTSSHYAKSVRQYLFGADPSISVEDDDDDDDNNNNNNEDAEIHSVSRRRHRRPRQPAKSTARTRSPPPSVSASSASSDEEDEMHYSERETNRLFGGPLTLLFRARQWRPLSDPYQVFVDVFGTDLNLGRPSASSSSSSSKGANMVIRALQPTSPAAVVPIRPSVPTSWTTTTTNNNNAAASPAGAKSKQFEQTVVCTTTRTLHDRVLIRTETIRQSPSSSMQPPPPTRGGGKGHDKDGPSPPPRRSRLITVTSEPIVFEEHDASNSASSLFSVCGGGDFWNARHCDFQLCLWE